ncbi:conserved hypothetical protein [Bathymodiolus platifrons methanotrophic gill symbiont]|uniref:hypothetical protein n=2 Tax=Bathymodiolus platifrons methanotrophic gill symbiont TaxID=113268 RepID=UPI000B73D19E|nr:hypothetical protein [Bathymodiolus platifrons methanotrophic gill symbiont]GAW87552.1 conserved hypothetical protein [Bathymodiolus platifrons methanotrophic gill symbiont]GFO76378.1 hypothetical protein BPLS_P4117 [Bathymodiolus platifrons methanotrophic gill symbiont]
MSRIHLCLILFNSGDSNMVKTDWLVVVSLAGVVFFAFLLLNQEEAEFEVATPKPTTHQIRAKEKKDAEIESLIKFGTKRKLDEIVSWGDDLTMEQIRKRDFYLKGGLIVASPEVKGGSESRLKKIRDNFHDMEVKGYYEVKRNNTNLRDHLGIVSKLKAIAKGLAPESFHADIKSISNYLRFEPTDINNSLFSEIPRISSNTYGSLAGDRWSAIKHIFDDPYLGVIRLDERRSGPGGRTKHVLPEELNKTVNGLPARYTVSVDPDGLPLAQLLWVNGKNMYVITAQWNTGTDSQARAYFFRLAESLPNPGV